MPPAARQSRNLQEEVGKRTEFDLPEQEAYLNLLRTHAVLSAQFTRLFKEFGLSDAQYNALRIIAGAGPSGIRSEQVGQRMVAHDPDTTRLIDRLQTAGLVERRRLAEDRRCVAVTTTQAGARLLKKLNPKVKELHRQQLGHLPRNQLKQLNDILFRIRSTDAA